MKYGGNTSCVELRLDDDVALVLDAGTGMRSLGASMQANPPAELHVLLTHLHMDHLQGLGFFRPLFAPDTDIHIWGPSSPVQHLAERIAMYLSPPLFPVRLQDVPARVTFHDAPEAPFAIGGGNRSRGSGVAPGSDRRVPDRGATTARSSISPTTNRRSAPTSRPQSTDWMSGHDLAREADVLLHDGQYRDHEYGSHVGWGHSRVSDVIEFANKADVEQLVLFHHDPYHTDAGARSAARRSARHTGPGWNERVCLASEGMTIALTRDGVTMRR